MRPDSRMSWRYSVSSRDVAEHLLGEDLREPDNGIERRAQLVGHVGEDSDCAGWPPRAGALSADLPEERAF